MSKKYIACFGDSLIYGFPFSPDYSWIARVEELEPELKLYNYGECGACCDEIYYNFKNKFLPSATTHVLFLGGANDILQGRPLKHIVQDMEKAAALACEKRLGFAIILPWLSADRSFNKRMSDLRLEVLKNFSEGVKIFDFQEVLGTDLEVLAEGYLDGIHPLAKTYKKIGEFAAPQLLAWVNTLK